MKTQDDFLAFVAPQKQVFMGNLRSAMATA
jgi:hypothetical protein